MLDNLGMTRSEDLIAYVWKYWDLDDHFRKAFKTIHEACLIENVKFKLVTKKSNFILCNNMCCGYYKLNWPKNVVDLEILVLDVIYGYSYLAEQSRSSYVRQC